LKGKKSYKKRVIECVVRRGPNKDREGAGRGYSRNGFSIQND
jgi:hypothetical protein